MGKWENLLLYFLDMVPSIIVGQMCQLRSLLMQHLIKCDLSPSSITIFENVVVE